MEKLSVEEKYSLTVREDKELTAFFEKIDYTTQAECEDAGLYWYDNQCVGDPRERMRSLIRGLQLQIINLLTQLIEIIILNLVLKIFT